ncbi:MAG: DUF5723 family protein [Bacteroidia bacterium]|nr:DUF5723 family protein [Bacteroidia bacterium]
MNRSWIYGIMVMVGFPAQVMLAQPGAALRWSPAHIHSLAEQPAYLETHPTVWGLGGGVTYSLASNVLTVEQMLLRDTFLDQSLKDQLVSQLGPRNEVRLALNQDWIGSFRVRDLPISLGYQAHTLGYVRLNNPQTLGLVLYGNAPYAGQPVEDKGIQGISMQYQAYSLGTARRIMGWDLGLRVKLLTGRNLLQVKELSYSFLTAADGSRVALQTAFERHQTRGAGVQGIGIGADLGIVREWKGLTVQAALLDIGAINWDATYWDKNASFEWNGIEISDLLSTDLSNGFDALLGDTLRTVLLGDSSVGAYRIPLPARVQAGAAYQTGPHRVFGSLTGSWVSYAAGGPVQGNLGYSYRLWDRLDLGAHVYAGGLDPVGAGVFAEGGVNFFMLHLRGFVSAAQAVGWVAPATGRGLSIQGGISLQQIVTAY